MKQKTNLPSIITNTVIYNKDFHKEILSEKNIDEIFTSCLECKLNDICMAAELRDSFFGKIFEYKERWYNLVHYISFESFRQEEVPKNIKKSIGFSKTTLATKLFGLKRILNSFA